MLTSTVCRYEHFRSPWFLRWSRRLGFTAVLDTLDSVGSHRKIWEWCAIAQALEERNMLQPSRRALGFAVGQEPLPSLFGSHGVRVLATDRPLGDSAGGWIETGQHAASLDPLFKDHLISRREFDDRVAFSPVDMKDLSGLEPEHYDFIWSSCSLEHLGSLQAGVDFIEASLSLLKVGGVAVHTTEYNISSNAETVHAGDNVLYRRRDVEAVGQRLRGLSALLLPPDFDPGCEPPDIEFDYEPYHQNGRFHIKLLMSGYVVTSMLLIVERFRAPVRPCGQILRTLPS